MADDVLVEGNLSEGQQKILDEMKAENPELKVETIESEDQKFERESEEGNVITNFDATEVEAKEKKGEEEVAEEEEAPLSDYDKIFEEKGINKEEAIEALKKDMTFKFNTKKGGEQEISYEEAVNHLRRSVPRESSSHSKLESLMAKEGEFIAMRKAAEEGDVSAQKALFNLVKGYSKEEDTDDFAYKMEGEGDEFDSKGAALKVSDELQPGAFDDLEEEGIDYQEVVDKLPQEFAHIIPPAILEDYMKDEFIKRSLYEVFNSPLRPKFEEAFQTSLDSLSLEKQLDLSSDPDEFGKLFAFVSQKVVRDEAKGGHPSQSSEQKDQGQTEEEGLEAVSLGTGAKLSPKSSAVPNFAKLSDADFAAFQAKNGLI